MHLVTCATPHEPLEAAPPSALVAEQPGDDRWDGFWSSDAYVVRRTNTDGDVQWYRLADEAPAPAKNETRVLALRARSRAQFVVAQSPNGRRILVGTAGGSKRGAR